MQSPSYYNTYSNNAIYEFDSLFDLNSNDLSIVATGYSVHNSKDVRFTFNITDRQSKNINSKSAIIENPFLNNIDIDILTNSGILIYPNYISGSTNNIFSFSEQENIAVFGKYQKDFGIKVSTISNNANIHSTEYYVYGNPLEIQSVSIRDGTGYWLNNNPIQYQSYTIYENSDSLIDSQMVINNALYFSGYKETISGYNANISGSIPFAFLTGESLKIDWGDYQIKTIFQQTGITGYSGASIINVTNTYTGDLSLTYLVNPTGINGQSYDFMTGYIYPTTGIYDVKFYYSGIGSTGNELIKTVQYRIPDELKPQGKPQIGDISTGKIEFDIIYENNIKYVNLEKLEIYASTGSGISIDTGNLNKVIPIFSQSKNYSFYLDKSTLIPNTNYWFNILPSGSITTGYGWEVGPYFIYADPKPKTNLTSESFTLINGEAKINIDFITGLIPTNEITIIDTISKGSGYSYEYLAQIKDQSECYCSSKLFIVDNTSGLDITRTGLSFSEYAISDNSFVNYSISGNSNNIYLYAQLNSPTGIYKLYKTSI